MKEETQAEPRMLESIGEYVLVRGDLASQEETEFTLYLHKALHESLGVELPLATDWHRAGETVPQREILIGVTTRPESLEALWGLRAGDWRVTMLGTKLVIVGGSDKALRDAVDYVIDEMIDRENHVLYLPENGEMLVKKEYPLASLTVDGVDITEFQILASGNAMAQKLQQGIAAQVGVIMDIPKLNVPSSGKHYIIAESTGLSGDDSSISIESGNIVIQAPYYALSGAVDYFLGEYLSGFHSAEIALTAKDGVTLDSASLTDPTLSALSVYGSGNHARLKSVMERAERGEDITLAFLGGSITAGSKASSASESYAARTVNWWRTGFPRSKLTYVNAGIGSTGSAIGMFRLKQDVLSKNPDLVVIEYALNDNSRYQNIDNAACYENIVRQCLQADAAVILLFMTNEIGEDASAEQKKIGEHYRVPMISVGDVLKQCMRDGLLTWRDFGADSTHPNTDGHAFSAQLLISYLQSVKDDPASPSDPTLPDPLTEEMYTEASVLDHRAITPIHLGGFSPDADTFRQFPNGWSSQAGAMEPMVFRLADCKNVTLLYHRSKSGAFGAAKVVVEANGECAEYTLNGDFSGGWGDYAEPCRVFCSNAAADVTVFVYPEGNSFSLLRIMTAR